MSPWYRRPILAMREVVAGQDGHGDGAGYRPPVFLPVPVLASRVA